ncbi:MAG: GHKL domain-containing protein [Acidovorax sp.]|jgi:two-component system OmpR family sensor kinase|nr:GHKL domain-containing protein [Acidovorax sp.]
MDGGQKRVNASLQRRLSLSLSLVIVLVALVAGVFSFLSAMDEANELQDDVLRQVAQLAQVAQGQSLPGAAAPLQGVDAEARVIVQRLGSGPVRPGPLALPAGLADGLQTLEVGGQSYRLLLSTTADGARLAVAQPSAFRDEIARDSALRTVMPLLLLVPVLLLIVAALVRTMFQPMAALAREIEQRAEHELHPVAEQQLPAEVQPFATAINRMLSKVEQSLQSQRRFVADAAHALRSPLTALSLQAERLAEAEMSAQAQERLAQLRLGLERGRQLLNQLLSLARAQSPTELVPAPLSAQTLYRQVLETLMPLAETRHIDLGVEGEQDAVLWACELDLFTLLSNLVDNAIRYTPPGGRVDLSVHSHQNQATLRIQDNGPGIPLAERDKVLQPFYRLLGNDQTGSGLGLSIVQTIAQRMGADMQLDFSDPARHSGLRVEIRLPLYRPAPQGR